MPNVKRIHHVAIVVDDLEKAIPFWRDGLGMQISSQKENLKENAIITFLPAGESEIELVLPTSTDSSLARFLEKRGPGMHHLCLEVDNISEMLTHLDEMGMQLINKAPVEGEGKRYAFIHPKSANGVLVELYELCE